MVLLGFSDHTQGPLASSLALAMGARVFEKHFTLDHNLQGPAHWFSEDPKGLKNWITSIKNSYTMMGNPILRPTTAEKEMSVLARRSIVVLKDIKKGEKITDENVGLRRPGNGLTPTFFSKVLNMRSSKKLSKGKLLELGDIL